MSIIKSTDETYKKILEDNKVVENDSDDNSEDENESQDEDNVTEDSEGT